MLSPRTSSDPWLIAAVSTSRMGLDSLHLRPLMSPPVLMLPGSPSEAPQKPTWSPDLHNPHIRGVNTQGQV